MDEMEKQDRVDMALSANSIHFAQRDIRKSFVLDYAGRTDVGQVRKHNEDAFAFASAGAAVPFAVVCDGMGGHLAGEVASNMAIDILLEQMRQLDHIHMGSIRKIVENANEAIFRHAVTHEACKGMGTTIVLAVFEAERVYVLNVGDSRAYHYKKRKEQVKQVSRDHSLVEEMVASKQISPEDAKTFPYRNIITRSLGGKQTVKVDFFELEWNVGDAILLCSDGLSNYCDNEVLTKFLRQEEEPIFICNDLVDFANQEGGADNITAVMVRRENPEEVQK